MGINSAALNFLKRELKDQTTRFGEDGERNSGSGGGGGGEKRMRLGWKVENKRGRKEERKKYFPKYKKRETKMYTTSLSL